MSANRLQIPPIQTSQFRIQSRQLTNIDIKQTTKSLMPKLYNGEVNNFFSLLNIYQKVPQSLSCACGDNLPSKALQTNHLQNQMPSFR